MTWPLNSLDLNPIEHLKWNFQKMNHENASSTKEDPLINIEKSWNHFDKEYYFKTMKVIHEKKRLS